VEIVATVANPLGVDPAPGCDTSGMTWSVTGGVCANGGLTLTANAAQEPVAALHSAPAGFDDTSYMVTVQTTFSVTTGVWVQIVGFDSGSRCEGQGVDIQPDGSWRIDSFVNCAESEGIWRASSLGPSPFSVTLRLQKQYFTAYINGKVIVNGGAFFTGGYPVISVGGTDGSSVTLTNVELDTAVNYSAQWSVLQDGRQRG
ncbi:MAG: hypothetical protein ACRDID_20035, partial [Ktedonobacterales bacterium]